MKYRRPSLSIIGVRSCRYSVDADDAGRDAARSAWLRWNAEGRDVRIVVPKIEGTDCADIIRARLSRRTPEVA